jgi:hypothetical protein
MITLIIFGFLFLLGFALLVALFGTSFLKRHAVRLPDRTRAAMYRGAGRPAQPPPARPAAQDFGDGYQAGVPQQRLEGAGAPARHQMPPQMYPASVSTGGGKWAFIVPVVVVAVVLVLLFGMREFLGSGAQPRLYFCESVDYARSKPISHSDIFTRGNVMLFVKSKTPLYLDRARVEVYRLDTEEFEPFLEKELRLKPEWESFSFQALFASVGQYSVYVYGNNDDPLVKKNITIVPDQFAYKPVRQ